MKEPQNKTVRLYQGAKEGLAYWQKVLGELTVPQLKAWCQPLKAILYECEVELVSAGGGKIDAQTVDKVIYSKKTLLKADIVYFLSLLLSDFRNLKFYVDSLSGKQILLWRMLLSNVYCSEKQLEGWNGESDGQDDDDRGFEYNPLSYKVWLLCVNAKSDEPKSINSRAAAYGFFYRGIGRFYFLPAVLRTMFVPLFFSSPEPQDSIPDEDKMFVFNGENSFMQAFPIMQMLYAQDVLKVGRTKVSAALAKKVKGKLNLNEFFDYEGGSEQLVQLRLNLTLPVVSLMFETFGGNKKTTAQDFLKNIEKYLCQCYTKYLPLILPHVKGIKPSWYVCSSIIHMVYTILGEFKKSEGKWLSMSNLVYPCIFSPIRPNPLVLFQTHDLANGNPVDTRTDDFIPLSKQVKTMGLPLMQGVVYILASLGLVEVAFRREPSDEGNPYPVLEYFRLTDLGKYAWGLTNSYTPAVSEHVGELLKLDEQRLIVRSLADNNPYEYLLSETAVPIGNNRYMMSSASFFKTCGSKREVADKIELYRQILGKDMPEHWKQFFDSLLHQCHPLKYVKNDTYTIYQIDFKNHGLIELLSSDAELRSLVIRAEGYRILVETDKVSVFKGLLKKRGYLM